MENLTRLKSAEKSVRFYSSELELMTTHQLREICRKEKIIHGVINTLDKEELIHTILRYRGADRHYFISQYDGERLDALKVAFARIRKDVRLGVQGISSSKIIVYSGIAIDFYDEVTINFDARFVGTNALLVSDDSLICGIFHVKQMKDDRDKLYLTKDADALFFEAPVKNYSLYCFDQKSSEVIYRFCQENGRLPEHMTVYKLPILDFEIREPAKLTIPLVIDFGTANTAAGVYLDSQYFQQMGIAPGDKGLRENSINYTLFYDGTSQSEILPTVVGVSSLEGGKPSFVFGFDAIKLAGSSYVDEGFCVYYDIKRWIVDVNKEEVLTDRQGRHMKIPRKNIIKAFLEYVVSCSKSRFKCSIDKIHISSPVKQKYLFNQLFSEIPGSYNPENDDMLDEGVAVLYNTISDRIASGAFRPGQPQKALIIDCGGGTTDLSSCTFQVEDHRVSYKIAIKTAYENGDTNFGGNNLTFRIMQLLKLELTSKLTGNPSKLPEILENFELDVFRFVDEHGTAAAYKQLDICYGEAESVIPTRFKDFERLGKKEYFQVKNNYYFLFQLAEEIKKTFFGSIGTLQILISSDEKAVKNCPFIFADKWKLSIFKHGKLEVSKAFPEVTISVYDIERLLRGDIYGIVSQFFLRMYENEELFDYSIIRLSGQSCKIDVFRDAIKEFVPGKIISFKRPSRDFNRDYELKMSCVDGALKYLKDKKYGYADIEVTSETPALPYKVTAFTHNGQEIELIHSLDRRNNSGNISRNMENLTLELHLKDVDDALRYRYIYHCQPSDFTPVTYDQIHSKYGELIEQAETDIIVDREVKFFVWAQTNYWGFIVVPVTRRGEELGLGKEQFYSFESDSWVRNFFDGTN